MSTISSDSRSYRAAGRPDRLLRAAVTSFCSITRPTRRETAQLDDLSGPLLGSVSDDTLRLVAASLSETPFAPPILVRRLADQPPDISAPLLLRSPVLGNIDLLALIGRHGIGHARVIAARHDLDERLARLVASLGVERQHLQQPERPHSNEMPANIPPPKAEAQPADVESTRERLRAMMRPAASAGDVDPPAEIRLRWDSEPGTYRKLRSTALTGVPALFHTALADALDLPLDRARTIAQAPDMSQLIVALRALHVAEEQAFLIVQCVWPARLAHVRAISGFFDAYGAVGTDQASEMIDQWRNPVEQDHQRQPRHAANQPSTAKRLKAS